MLWLLRAMIAFALLLAPPAFADSWALPQRTTYESADKTVRFTVVPRDLGNQLAYFSDKVDGKDPAGQRGGGESRARGMLERRSGSKWVKVWEGALVNDVSPVRALVANDGSHVVTFDNWHSTGYGENVVVIYRRDGSVVRSMTLSDMVPEDYVRALPRSVSSLWWSGDHAFSADGRQLILKIVIPNRSGSIGKPRGYLDVPVSLEDGAVAPPSDATWKRAMAAAAPLIAASKAGDAEWRARRIAPLLAPGDADGNAWSRYLYQAVLRLALADDRRIGLDAAWVLPGRKDPAFAARSKDIREIFAEWDSASDLSFASPAAPEELARILSEGARSAPAGRLRGSRLFVGLPAAMANDVRTALERTGATVILFDPAVPIPQRAEVLQELGVSEGRIQAEVEAAQAAARGFRAEAARLAELAPPEPKGAGSEEDETIEELVDDMAESVDGLAERAAKDGGPE